MKIAIIGAGYVGLAAGYTLSKFGHDVTIFERDKEAGGLASGFKPAYRRGKDKNWEWKLEKAYHHLFQNDTDILSLCKELGIENKLLLKRPLTAIYQNGTISQFDSPSALFSFHGLSFGAKLQTACLLAFLKINPFWKPLEKITAASLFQTIGGKESWRVLWEPLLLGKFGPYKDSVPASWLWARVFKRTPRLYYFKGGFSICVHTLVQAIKKQQSSILLSTQVDTIVQEKNKFRVSYGGRSDVFDTVILTIPSPIACTIVPDFPKFYKDNLLSIPHLHAQTLILETDEPILEKTYWLNISNRSFPFLAVVAHTNFMDKKYYGGKHITYIGNYLPPDHPYLKMTKEQLLKIFMPYIRRLNPSFQLSAVSCQLFTAPFAQPVHTLNYSQKAPQFSTPIPGIFIANLDSIVPWDRGTNYAVKLGKDVAEYLIKSK
ncbi:FAD-dependent oxidoreductase [Candidatus Gottesmanbacteria bacterium]|nr:FAD-dependent oxidoreductase [Candidatus Gottesmanbacteria bacterium]